MELGREVHDVDADAAGLAIRGYRVLAGLRDASPFDEIILPTARDRGVCDDYARWGDTFNCVSELIPADAASDPYTAEMTIQVNGFDPVRTRTASYLHRAPAAISTISQFATLQPGDIISLGRAGELLRIPAATHLPDGATVTARIEGLGAVEAIIEDRRASGQ